MHLIGRCPTAPQTSLTSPAPTVIIRTAYPHPNSRHMTTTRPTFIDYTPSPSSQRSVYFDAPIMHIFSKEPSNDEDFVAPSPTRTNQVPFNDSEAGEGSTRRSSVTIEPVTIPQPQYEDCNEPAEESTLNATDYVETDKEPPRSRHGSESAEGGPMLDSGYNSASPIARPSSMDAGEDMMPIPVVWADNGSHVPQPSW